MVSSILLNWKFHNLSKNRDVKVRKMSIVIESILTVKNNSELF